MSALARRAGSISRTTLMLVVALALAPVLLPLAVLFDLGRLALRGTPMTTSRLYVFGVYYFVAELVGLAVLGLSWLRRAGRRAAMLEPTYAIQAAWAGALLWAIRVLFDVRFELVGAELCTPGPVLLFVRHASIVDTLLPTALIGWPNRMRLRFVLKRELLALPCLDVAGNRLPNAFVGRDGADSAREIAKVRVLGEGLGERDGVVIYPEGTRATEAKRARALAKLELADRARFERVRGLASLLPVRPGGPLALLEAAPEADVVFVGHTGFEGFAELADIWKGGMVGRRVRIELTRHERALVPVEPAARLAWLDARWAELDARITAANEPVGSAPR
jgi:1-acyl-sn-glycerol-3-phosphate acyltransferase